MHEAHTANGSSANKFTNGVKILEALHLVRLASVKGEERLAATTFKDDGSGFWFKSKAHCTSMRIVCVDDGRKGTATLDRLLKGTLD